MICEHFWFIWPRIWQKSFVFVYNQLLLWHVFLLSLFIFLTFSNFLFLTFLYILSLDIIKANEPFYTNVICVSNFIVEKWNFICPEQSKCTSTFIRQLSHEQFQLNFIIVLFLLILPIKQFIRFFLFVTLHLIVTYDNIWTVIKIIIIHFVS